MSSPGSGGCWRPGGQGVRGREVPEDAALGPGLRSQRRPASQLTTCVYFVNRKTKQRRQICLSRRECRCWSVSASSAPLSRVFRRSHGTAMAQAWGCGRDAHLCGALREAADAYLW